MSETYAFPDRLCALQRQLDRVQRDYREHCRTLPWSVEPMIARTYQRPGMGGVSQTITHPDSPGYTPEQQAVDQRLRRRLLRLAVAVATHEWWASAPAGERVDARMALKQLCRAEQSGCEAG